MPDPRERIVFESIPPAGTPPPLWLQVALGVVVGGVILFSIWLGYQKYQEYRLARALQLLLKVFSRAWSV